MKEQDRDLSRVIGWLAGIVAVGTALGLPGVYFAVGYNSMASALRTEAQVCSREVGRIAGANPGGWEHETVRIDKALGQRFESLAGDSRRVLDGERRVVAATVGPAPWPALVRSEAIHASGHRVGAVEIGRTLRPLIARTALAVLAGVLLGIAVYLVLWLLPMVALRKALGQLAREKERAQVTVRAIPDAVIATDAARRRRRKVLVMDDEDLVREMEIGMLEHLGCEAIGAPDGGEAIRMYEDAAADGTPFDLAVMDLTVPGKMGGREACARLLARHPDARVIVCSGHSSDPVMSDHTTYGFLGKLAKPFHVEDLKRVMDRAMAHVPAHEVTG